MLSLFDNACAISIRYYERAPQGAFLMTVRFPDDDILKDRIERVQTITELAFIDLDLGVVEFLTQKGFRHLPLPKHHQDPNATCLRAYQEFNFRGYRICANQFSDFFGYKIFQSKITLPTLESLFYGDT